jgi:hypothetical protein
MLDLYQWVFYTVYNKPKEMKEMKSIKYYGYEFELVHEDATNRDDDLQKIGLQFIRREAWGVQILEIKVHYYKKIDLTDYEENHITFTKNEFETIYNKMKGVETVEQSV